MQERVEWPLAAIVPDDARPNYIDCDLKRQAKLASFAVRAIVHFDRIAQESGELIYGPRRHIA